MVVLLNKESEVSVCLSLTRAVDRKTFSGTSKKRYFFQPFELIYHAMFKSSLRLRLRHNFIPLVNILNKMSSSFLKPPESVRGMTELDKRKFQKEIQVLCLNLKNVKLSTITPILKKYFLKMECFKAIHNINNESFCVYLNPEKVTQWTDIATEDRVDLEKLDVNVESKSLIIKFENYSADTILKAILPSDQEGMSSYTKIGHIVHINLREHLDMYKQVIGKVLLEKVVNCRTVVNKIDMIDNTYRNFQMEVLCGDNDMIATVKENFCTYRFDFSKVYWNSRLSTEHERLVKMFKTGDAVFDVFAGVGPFAIPAAKKKCFVYANDLNPESYKWLNHNKKLNKVDDKYLKTFCKDGKDFILNDLRENLLRYDNVHIVMNLPALAVEFLEYFIGLYDVNERINNVTLHVYCFTKGEDYMSLAKALVTNSCSTDISENIIEIFRVRTVSSLKEMMRVSINLTKEILTKRSNNKRKVDCVEQDENNKKRQYHNIQVKLIY